MRGIELRCDFSVVLAKLGEPGVADYSPQMEGGDRFGTYDWPKLGVAVLTWLTEGSELVWGVRLYGADYLDTGLFFGIGSTRKQVLERLPPGWRDEHGVITMAVEGGHVTISFQEDRVSVIELMAPME